MRFFFFSLFILFGIYPLKAQKYWQGKVLDVKRNPLFAVNIYLKNDPKQGTISDEQGNFTLFYSDTTYPDTLVVSFIGYQAICLPIDKISSGKPLQIILRENNLELTEIVVKANPSLSQEFSVKEITRLDIYNTPLSSGDALKMITFLPSSTNTTEGAEPELRGSAAGLSRVVFNDVPVYKPVRNSQIDMPGHFSIFNTELLGTQNIYAGNPPLIYGNALAGLAEIRTLNRQPLRQTQLSASLANIGLLYAQPLGKRNFMQSYGNYQFSVPLLGINPNKYLKSFRSEDLGINLHFENRNHWTFNLYSYAIDENYEGYNYLYNYKGKVQADKQRNFYILNLKYRKNQMLISWNSGFDWSRETYYFGNISSRQKEYILYSGWDLKYFLNTAFYLQGGISLEHARRNYGGKSPYYFYAVRPQDPIYPMDLTISNSNLECFLYSRWQPFARLKIGIGIRKNIPVSGQKSYCSYQSNIRYTPAENHSILLGIGQYNGYSVPGYFLQAYTPISSRQYSLEYQFRKKETDLQLACYIKEEKYTDYLTEIGTSIPLKNKLIGLEAAFSHNWSKFHLSVSYTFLYARQYQNGQQYNASNRMNYLLKFSATYQSRQWGSLSLSGIARPGLYYTPVYSGLPDAENSVYIPLYGTYHSQRYSAYSTFGITYNKILAFKKNYMVLFATLNNILNRKNQNDIFYASDYSHISQYTYYAKRMLYFGLQYNF
ncbi:TonB-dependent receptor [Odoribacter laneus]|uniref:TonB-dependent receptor plug domain-containing protein n=1 Tax=Odoribacter laneus YIT 12061 TaxID=742817 RepID=H1DHY7_9BACT|nr:TonB-dependent receptor [Odoribacter laneus]EHP46858.1 hypothetical protein HMPREF9449_01873 [Odoribacter laneus YIT 12061]